MTILIPSALGQVGVLTCLILCFGHPLAQSTPDWTMVDYAGRLLWSTPFKRCDRPEVSNDSVPLTTITGSGGYDLVYREKAVDSSLVKLKDSRTNAFDAALLFRTIQKGWGLQGGWGCSRLNSTWAGEDYAFREESILSFNQLLLGGWWHSRHTTLDGMISIDPGYCSKANLNNTLYREKAAAIWNSPGLDLNVALTLAYPNIELEYYYRNSASSAGYHIITTQSNSARRHLPLLADENSFGVAAMFTWDAITLHLNGAFNLLGGDVDTGTSYDLPLSLNGYGVSGEAAIGSKRLPYRPQLHLSGAFTGFDVEGFDGSGNRFLRVEDNVFSFIEGEVDLHSGKHSSFGPLVSFVRIKADDGKVDLYPFTGWLYVLDLPEGYKVYDVKLLLTEGGLFGRREWRPLCNHSLKTDITITGSRIYGLIETAEQVRVIIAIPDYQNRATDIFINNKYIVAKASLNYSYTLGLHKMFISFQQILPIELSTGAKGSGKHGGGVDKRLLYGGMRLDGGVVIRL